MCRHGSWKHELNKPVLGCLGHNEMCRWEMTWSWRVPAKATAAWRHKLFWNRGDFTSVFLQVSRSELLPSSVYLSICLSIYHWFATAVVVRLKKTGSTDVACSCAIRVADSARCHVNANLLIQLENSAVLLISSRETVCSWRTRRFD